MFLETTPKWEMALVRMFGKRIVDERGRHVCWMWRGKPYFRIARYPVEVTGKDRALVLRALKALKQLEPAVHGAAPGPTSFAWICTKHGVIPFQDCEQCKAESAQNRGAES